MNYRSLKDRNVSFAFAALFITIVGSLATMLIVKKAEALTWNTNDRYEHYLASPTESPKPGIPRGR